MTLSPLQDRVLIRRKAQEEITKGGIYVPDAVKEKQLEGTVVAVGPGRLLENGVVVPIPVSIGDSVVYGLYAGVEIQDGDETILCVRADEIIAIKGHETHSM